MEPAEVGGELLGALDNAIGEMDSGTGDHADQIAWDEASADARRRWPELVAYLADADATVRVSGCEVIAAFARGAWGSYADYLKVHDFTTEIIAAAERLPLTDREPIVRAAALEALRWIRGDSDGLSVLVDKAIELLADLVPQVRANAVHVVAVRLGKACDVLHPLCDDREPVVEDAIIETLMHVRDPALGPVLVRRARREGRATPSSETATHIRHLGVPAARDALLDLLVPETDGYVRAAAANALIEHVDLDCLPALHRVLAFGDFSSRYAALALMRLGPAAAHPGLAAAILTRGANPPATYRDNDSGHQQLVSIAAMLVAAVGQVDHAPALMGAFEREDRLPRPEDNTTAILLRGQLREIAFALATLRHPPIFDVLRRDLNRGNACLALGQLGDPRALDLLDEVLRRGGKTRDLARMQRDAALAIASIDPSRIDADLVTFAGRSWPTRDLGFAPQFTFALRTLALRLAAAPHTGAIDAMRELLVHHIGLLAPALDHDLVCYRGLGTTSSVTDGYVFANRDWLADAVAALTVS